MNNDGKSDSGSSGTSPVAPASGLPPSNIGQSAGAVQVPTPEGDQVATVAAVPAPPVGPGDGRTTVPPVAPPTVLPQPTAPVGGPRKEAPVMGSGGGETVVAAEADKVAKEENDEYWLKFSKEIEAEKEAVEVGGMEKISNAEAVITPKLAAEMGVKPTPTPISQHQGDDFTVRGVSLTDDQITMGAKKSSAFSLRWLVEWFVYQLLKAHFLVKRVHGKFVRQKPSS